MLALTLLVYAVTQMSPYVSRFARELLVEVIGIYGEDMVVDEILKGSLMRDIRRRDETSVSAEMKSFLKALQLPISTKMGG